MSATRKTERRMCWAILFVFVAALVVGCQSSRQPKPGAEGAFRVSGKTPAEIAGVLTQVFTANDYLVSNKGLEKLVFEKPAGKFSNFAYGNWMGEGPVWRRIKVFITPVEGGAYDIRCEAFNVRDRGGPTEEEISVTNFRTGSCRKLLREAINRLKH
jgi:hypothetical protein